MVESLNFLPGNMIFKKRRSRDHRFNFAIRTVLNVGGLKPVVILRHLDTANNVNEIPVICSRNLDAIVCRQPWRCFVVFRTRVYCVLVEIGELVNRRHRGKRLLSSGNDNGYFSW